MKTIVLHLTGPLQSWAGPALVKTRVDTKREPGVQAIRGLLLAAFGVPRGESLSIVDDTKIEIASIRSGRIVRDFQTISSRDGEEFYAEKVGRILERGKRRPNFISANNATMVVNRTYLGDAAFLIAIQGHDDSATEKLLAQLLNPRWSPYLGKRAFAPTFPFILGAFDEEPKDAFESARTRLNEIQEAKR